MSMRTSKLIGIVGVVLGLWAATAQATDVINQDERAYTIKVQGEGKLSVSNHPVRARGSLYGLCNYSFCSFEIPGSKVTATRDGRLMISNGKFTK